MLSVSNRPSSLNSQSNVFSALLRPFSFRLASLTLVIIIAAQLSSSHLATFTPPGPPTPDPTSGCYCHHLVPTCPPSTMVRAISINGTPFRYLGLISPRRRVLKTFNALLSSSTPLIPQCFSSRIIRFISAHRNYPHRHLSAALWEDSFTHPTRHPRFSVSARARARKMAYGSACPGTCHRR